MLANPFYAGYISNKLLEGRIIKGRHKPLVSEIEFLKANENRKHFDFRTRKTESNPKLPLKNMIWCEKCNRGHLTGYLMKKRGIWYYKCSRKNCRTNRRADVMHEKFRELLSQYAISSDQADALKSELKQTFALENKQKADDTHLYRRELDIVKNKLTKLQEKFITDQITKDVYDSFTEELVLQQIKLEDLIKHGGKKKKSDEEEFVEFALNLSQDMVSIWDHGDAIAKIDLAKLVFPMGVWYCRERDSFETVAVNEALVKLQELQNSKPV